MKENWLESLSCPFEQQDIPLSELSSSCKQRKSDEEGCLEKWVIGIDPDIHGALALLKDSDGFGVSSVSAEEPPHILSSQVLALKMENWVGGVEDLHTDCG